jgi:hypothetical protein
MTNRVYRLGVVEVKELKRVAKAQGWLGAGVDAATLFVLVLAALAGFFLRGRAASSLMDQ